MSKLHGNRVEIGTLSTSAKNSLGSVPNGTIVYDTDLNEIQYYNPQGWLPISTGQKINATGGSISNSSRSGYRVHTFTSPGTFQVTSGSNDVEYRVIAGGGGGGQGGVGGAGFETGGGVAGGHATGTEPVTPGNYPVSVGGGGGNTAFGTASSFANVNAVRGGAGGGRPNTVDGGPGGSGGGGAYNHGEGGTGTGGQGNPGGKGTQQPNSGGGGGGSGGAG